MQAKSPHLFLSDLIISNTFHTKTTLFVIPITYNRVCTWHCSNFLLPNIRSAVVDADINSFPVGITADFSDRARSLNGKHVLNHEGGDAEVTCPFKLSK